MPGEDGQELEPGKDIDPQTGLFLKGKKGGPGRPKGSRNKLGEDFLQALHADFAEHGASTIETVRKERPADYLKVIAGILPKDVNVNVNGLEELDDAQLVARLRQLDQLMQPFLAAQGAGAGAGADPAGTEETTRH